MLEEIKRLLYEGRRLIKILGWVWYSLAILWIVIGWWIPGTEHVLTIVEHCLLATCIMRCIGMLKVTGHQDPSFLLNPAYLQ